MLTAVTDSEWEAELLGELQQQPQRVQVVRRCLDVADLLAAAATGAARAAVVSADLRRFDGDVLARLASARVGVLVLVPGGDPEAARRWRQAGASHLLSADASAAAVTAAIVQAAAAAVDRPLPDDYSGGFPGDGRPPPAAVGVYPAEPGTGAAPGDGPRTPTEPPHVGQVVAVWGPTGAPGRTTVAVNLADELARRRVETLLVDADVYGGVVAAALGLLDEAAGLAAAARQATAGQLDVTALAGHARRVRPGLRVLTGLARADRWPELRPSAISTVLGWCRRLAGWTVVDCGFAVEQDEELSYDTAAPRRNGATLTVLREADLVLAVGTADPIGLQRLVRGLAELRDVLPEVRPRVVVNRLRASVVHGDPKAEIEAALVRYAGVRDPWFVPFDPASCDAALRGGRTLAEAAAQRPARLAVAGLADALTGRPPPPRRRPLRSARR